MLATEQRLLHEPMHVCGFFGGLPARGDVHGPCRMLRDVGDVP
jgi:hypothetical protein